MSHGGERERGGEREGREKSTIWGFDVASSVLLFVKSITITPSEILNDDEMRDSSPLVWFWGMEMETGEFGLERIED